MPVMTAAAIAGGASLLGGFIGNSSARSQAREATAASENMAREQRAWQQQENQRQREFEASSAYSAMDFSQRSNATQMAFQERLANSAHQREVADLRAAGLNPILSGTGGMGSATPQGSSSAGTMAHSSPGSGATGQAFKAEVRDFVTPAIATALNVANSAAERDLLEAQRRNTESETHFRDLYQTAKTDAEIATMVIDQGLKSEQANLSAVQARSVEANMDKIRPEIEEIVARGKAHIASAARDYASKGNIDQETRTRRVNAAADEWSEEYAIPRVKRALEVVGMGSESLKDLSQAIVGGIRGLLLGPARSGSGSAGRTSSGNINPYLRKN